MSYEQVITPNYDIQGTLGYCLQYVQQSFNVGWAGTDAWNTWTSRLSLRHQGETPPQGIMVPVWFDGYWLGQELGHVGIWLGDGRVACSPWKAGQKYAILDSIAQVEQIYHMSYVGWSEDLAGQRLIKEVDDVSKTTITEERALAYSVAGRNGVDGSPNALNGDTDADLNQNHVGSESNKSIDDWLYSPEAADWRNNRLPNLVARAAKGDAAQATIDELTKQVNDFSARPTQEEIDSLKSSLTDANTKLAAAEAQANQLAAQQASDAETGNAFLRWIGNWFNKNK